LQIDSEWKILDIKNGSIERRVRDAFLSNSCAGIRVESLISPQDLQKLTEAIDGIGLEYFQGDDKGGAIVRKGKLGPNFFRFKEEPFEYFERVRVTWPVFTEKILSQVDLYKLVQQVASEIFDLPTETATHAGNMMMGCTVRDLGTAPIHRDWMPGETQYLDFAHELQDQFAWNFYLKIPDRGGETVIYRTDEIKKLDDETDAAKCRPLEGDLLIFRSTRLHEVLPSEGERMTFSGFFGPRKKKLLFWV
jgi:hypothetical protein